MPDYTLRYAADASYRLRAYCATPAALPAAIVTVTVIDATSRPP